MDKITLILSIIAIIISIIVPLFEYLINKHTNFTNLMSMFYAETYKEYLMILIPESRKKIGFIDDKINDTENLEIVLQGLRTKSTFFSYQNKRFFNNLNKKINSIDDLLVQHSGRNVDYITYNKFITMLDKRISKLYKYINNKYVGK